MIKIGVVNIDTSHPLAFSKYLAGQKRAGYAAIYNDGFRGDDEVSRFMEHAGAEKRCRSIEELAECTDIGFIQSCNWDKHIEQAMPFIDAGKPVFIDKPMVGNVKDCRRIKTLAEQGAVILGSSSVRYAEEIETFLKQPVDKRGHILNVFGTSGIDEFNYGIHIVEAVCKLISSRPIAARYVASAEKDGQRCETYSIAFEDDSAAVYNIVTGCWHPFEIVIMTTLGTHHFQIDVTKIYGALLDKICDYMETGANTLADIPTLTESIRAMLAGRVSKEQGGRAVDLHDIPADDPGFDGGRFEKDYAANAQKIY